MTATGLAMDDLPSRVRRAVLEACQAELAALKPGNVHVHADGHGMTVEDFRISAEVTADILSEPGFGVGERVRACVATTMENVGCNTNLGIILLCAPLARAALLTHDGAPLQSGLREVLDALDVEDAVFAYEGIRQAGPAGLGTSDRFDVAKRPTVSLLEAMTEAAERDMIARQYANGYADVFEFSMPRLRDALSRWNDEAWAITSVYLGFLGHYPDSHVARSLGTEAADALRREGGVLDARFQACRKPSDMYDVLMDFDARLKARNVNPGTSADLTVATLFARCLCNGEDANGN